MSKTYGWNKRSTLKFERVSKIRVNKTFKLKVTSLQNKAKN